MGVIFLLYTLDLIRPEDVQQAIETWLQFGTQILSRTAEAAGALIIAVGVLSALFSYTVSRIGGRDRVAAGIGRTEGIRLQLGRILGLSLEFLLAADILSTAVAPTWDAIGKLAAIATIRTLLNYFLARELRQEEERRAGAALMLDRNRADTAVKSS